MGLTLLFVSFSVTADTKVHPARNSAQSAFLGQVLTHSIHKMCHFAEVCRWFCFGCLQEEYQGVA